MYDYYLTINVDTVPHKRMYHISTTIQKQGSEPNVFEYTCTNIRDGIDFVHDKILSLHHNEELAKEAGITVALKYRRYDDLVIEQCQRHGIPYDPFVVLDDHSRFVLQLSNITSM